MQAVAGGGETGRLPVVVIAGALIVVAAAAVSGQAVLAAAGVSLAAAILALGHRALFRWHVLVAGMILVILWIPIKRYSLPGGLPFDLEPYRVVIALVAAAWLTSLLIDSRVRLRASGFEAPLFMFFGAVLCSVITNGGRIHELAVEGQVIKTVTFFASFVIVFYICVSIVQTREQLDRLIRVLVGGGGVVAFFALLESRTGYNFFNHLGEIVPILHYEDPAETFGLDAEYLNRAGRMRVYASAAHPIELAASLVMLVPLGIYLVRKTGSKRWLVCTGMIGLAALTTVSRTAIIMLIVLAAVYLKLRPVETKRLWPLLLPGLLVVYFALPNVIGSFYAAFFPQGGIVAEQSTEVEGNELGGDGRLADLGPSWKEFTDRPIFGQGFGSRVSTRAAETQGIKRNARVLDNQWLYSVLETGIVGIVGLFWLFRRSIRRLYEEARRDVSPDGWLAVGLAASLFGFAVAMLTFDSFGFIQVTILMFVVLGLSAALLRLPRETSGRV